MTFIQQNRRTHQHRYFVDANSGDQYCICGKKKDDKESASKYKNKSSEYNGIVYHSIFESEYAQQLDWWLKCGEIKSWQRQVRLDLKVNGHHINNYYIDFVVHHHDGHREFVECKGMQLEPWKTNWKILEATFDDFKEHPDDTMVLIQESKTPRRYPHKKLSTPTT